MKAVLIALEGGHGAGKTTLAHQLMAEFKKETPSFVYSRDQAGTRFSETIRNLNLDEQTHVDVYTETFLVAAARRQTYVDIIKPALQQQKTVLTERFVDAFFAYGSARNLHADFVSQIAEAACDGHYPDLTIVLDVAPQVGLARIENLPKHRIELEGLDFHARLREGYLVRAHDHRDRTIVIDASQPCEQVCTIAAQAIRSKL